MAAPTVTLQQPKDRSADPQRSAYKLIRIIINPSVASAQRETACHELREHVWSNPALSVAATARLFAGVEIAARKPERAMPFDIAQLAFSSAIVNEKRNMTEEGDILVKVFRALFEDGPMRKVLTRGVMRELKQHLSRN